MKTRDLLLLAAGLVVLYVLWKRMHAATTTITPGVAAANPFAAVPNAVATAAGAASAGLSAANQAVNIGTSAASGLAGRGAKLAVKTAALPLTLGYSVTKSVVKALNPFSWGGDSAATKRDKEMTAEANARNASFASALKHNATMTPEYARGLQAGADALNHSYWGKMAYGGKVAPSDIDAQIG